MAISAFDNKSTRPSEAALKAVLGPTGDLWNEVKGLIASRWGPTAEDWGFSSKKAGWSFRIKHKKRTVLYMIPCDGHFQVAFVLGDRAVAAARHSGLPEHILDLINSAKRYVEGTGFRFEVRKQDDLRTVETLATIKMAH